jgi:hypothetical protein
VSTTTALRPASWPTPQRPPALLLRLLTTGELSGTLGPHATDGPTGWWIDLGVVSPAASGHAQAGTAVCGTALTFSPG